MTKKLIEKGDLVWKTVAMALLSVCVYFLVQINQKVDYSYKFNVEQNIINQHLQNDIVTLETLTDRMGLNLAELAQRQYKLESKLQ